MPGVLAVITGQQKQADGSADPQSSRASPPLAATPHVSRPICRPLREPAPAHPIPRLSPRQHVIWSNLLSVSVSVSVIGLVSRLSVLKSVPTGRRPAGEKALTSLVHSWMADDRTPRTG